MSSVFQTFFTEKVAEKLQTFSLFFEFQVKISKEAQKR
jgi:hypothetical protein